MAQLSAEDLLARRRTNALVGWLLLVFLGFVAGESLVLGDIAWATFVLVVLVLCIIPPVAFRDPEVMLPWEVLALAALPTFGRAVATLSVVSDFTLYVSVAALALVVAVELDLFTDVRMTVGFAIAFVALATLATAGVWAVFRWTLDTTLGTTTLLEPGVSDDVIHDQLMIEFVYSALAGLIAGVVFEVYFRRFADVERFPDDAGVSERDKLTDEVEV
jgi:hypothetical protein